MMAMRRMSSLVHMSPSHQALGEDLKQYMEESEKVRPPFFIRPPAHSR